MELAVRYKGEDQVLQIEEDDVISVPSGLVGFADWRRFVLLEDTEEPSVGVLQCLDDTDISFLVTDPTIVMPNYNLQLSLEDVRELGLTRQGSERALCILTIKKGPVIVTANLLAPIVINSETRVARQVIMEDSEYSTRHPVLVARGKHASRRARSLASCAR